MIKEVLNNDRKDQSEDQTASLLLDALSGYDMPFATDIKVVNSSTEDDAEEGCPDGYEHLFQKVWLGMEEGCAYNGKILSEEEYEIYFTNLNPSTGKKKKRVPVCAFRIPEKDPVV